MEASRRTVVVALLALKTLGVPLLTFGLAMVYLVLGLQADGAHRRCYLMAAALYLGLALLKLA
jgi:hypothetical protein